MPREPKKGAGRAKARSNQDPQRSPATDARRPLRPPPPPATLSISSMLLVIYLSLILPYRLAFLTGWEFGFVVTDFLMDVFFLFDLEDT